MFLYFGCKPEDSLLRVNEDEIRIITKENVIQVNRNGERVALLSFFSDQYTIYSFGGDKEISLVYIDGKDSPNMTWYFLNSEQNEVKDFDAFGNLITTESSEEESADFD
jgi:uncharacterized protein (DUF427 family)